MIRAIICWTYVVWKPKPQLAWCMQISPRSNSPKGWSRAIIVCWTCVRKHGWLSFSPNSIMPLAGGKPGRINIKIDTWIWRWWLKLCWLMTFENCPQLEKFVHSKPILRHWFNIFVNIGAFKVQDWRRMGSQGNHVTNDGSCTTSGQNGKL